MPTTQEQRDETRRLYGESIVCQQRGHERGEKGVKYKMGDTCPHCQDLVGDPLLERIPAAERPKACEDNGGHEVEPLRWPPTNRYSSSKRPPAMNLRCRRCRANVVVYDPPQEGIKLLGVAGGVKVKEAVKA